MLSPKEFIEDAIQKIKDQIGDEKAIIALSGGVDSSVCSVLVQEAIGDNLTAVFVDHGLLREGEVEQVTNTFKDRLNFKFVDASDEFMDQLAGVEDPEEKRKIIGRVFIEVFEREAIKSGAKFLVQGTIALCEPIRDLYKDEVREIGDELGLPATTVYRQPFPGPGLGVRVVGDLTRENVEICRKANKIVCDEIEAAGIDKDVWQYFAVRVVNSIDAMTASVAELPWEVVQTISKRITSEISEVTHVALSISDKPPATIEFC